MRYWKRVDALGATITVESYSHNLKVKGAEQISQEEYEAFISTLPAPPVIPPRDLASELDALEVRVTNLEGSA